MTHDRFEEMLARRGELTPAEEERLQGHLRLCPQCQATAAAYEQQTRLLRGLPPVDPPPALRAGVLAGIRDVAPPRRWWSPRPTFLLGPAAAVLLLVGAFALHDLNPGGSAVNTAAPPVPTASTPVKIQMGPAGSASKLSHGLSSPRPIHAPKFQPQRHAGARKQAPQAPAPQAPVPTGVPVQNVPGIALGPPPTAPAADTAVGPVQKSPHTGAGASRPQSPKPVKVAPRPVSTVSASKPPVVAAPTRPTVAPAIPTSVPVTGVTAAAPSAPPTPEPYLTPTSTSTAAP